MTNMKAYGYTGVIPKGKETVGRVIEIQKTRVVIITEHGEIGAKIKGSFRYHADSRDAFPCVGDFVKVLLNKDGDSWITDLLPRSTKFSRSDFSGHAVGYVKTVLEQLVAANFDYVFITTSLNQDFNVNRVLRYLAQTRQSGAAPVILLTKSDLATGEAVALAEKRMKEAVGQVPILSLSAYTGDNMDSLAPFLLPGKTIVFLGMSGVGKSTMINALMKQDVMAVNPIRDSDSRGHHTTTHRHLFMLPCGTMVIDTPGMRELGLYDCKEGIHEGYSDVEILISRCRYHDCKHADEPGCAVTKALVDGSLSSERWKAYLAQQAELSFADAKKPFQSKKEALKNKISKNK